MKHKTKTLHNSPSVPRRTLLGGVLLGLLAPAVLHADTQTGAGANSTGISDAQLMAALDLTTPDLKAVQAALDTSDLSGAKKALCAYFRNRTSVPWTFDYSKRSVVPFNRAVANATLGGKVPRSTGNAMPIGDIDWRFDEKHAAANPAFVASLRTALNRMPFWGSLGEAYWATGEEKYAEAWVQQMQKWVAQQPQPKRNINNQFGKTSWLTIDTGLRMAGSWPQAYHRFLHSPSFTDDALIVFLKSCLQHGQHLKNFATSGNWLTMEMNGLYSVGSVFPEFKEAASWRAMAVEKLYADQKVQFLPDGAQVEGTPGYHNIAISSILNLYDRAALMGRLNELPDDYRARLENGFNYDLFLMAPDRTLPKLNDSWPDDMTERLARAAQIFPKREDFLWVATGGKQGKPPTETSHAFPYVGYFAMRSGWETDANYLVFDAGPPGYAHVHQDKLNVVLWAYGRPVLFDSGGGAYDDSVWRKWAIDTPSHNTVLVDNKPQRRPNAHTPEEKEANVSRVPLQDTRWKTTPTYDFAGGIYQDGYGSESSKPASHVRRVLFVKPDIFIVADTLTPNDDGAHTYEARWHLLSTQTNHDETIGMVTTKDTNQPNLAVVPLFRENVSVRAVSAQTKPELLGWEIRKEKDPPNVPATTVLHLLQGKGMQHFLTLLLPLKAGGENAVKSVRRVSPTVSEVSLSEGRFLRVEASADPKGTISVQESQNGRSKPEVIGQ